MKRYVILEKKVGETPLMTLSSFRKEHPVYADIPASYAGRLDPMASGKLLVLLGDECKRQKEYTGLDKEYEVEVLLDIGSDTGDVLGVVGASGRDTRVDQKMLREVVKNEEGAHERAYPIYSSKTVNGKPLFLYALEGRLGEIEIPMHQEEIYRISLLHKSRISSEELRLRINELLSLAPTSDEPSKVLGADFRIQAVRESWQQVFAGGERTYCILKIRVACASGTYMRSLAPRMGEALGTNALALSIHRTKIGKRWGWWWREY